MRKLRQPLFLLLAFAVVAQNAPASEASKVSLAIRGTVQTLHVLMPDQHEADTPTVVAVSGDGGWHGLIVDITDRLVEKGHVVVGLDAKAYLESSSKTRALEPAQVTSDLGTIAQFAQAKGGTKKVVLLGWSEGAGLVVLGGLEPELRKNLCGVVAIGLPELNELAWSWADSVIYVTHKVPKEPTFNSNDFVGRLAPVPFMSIQSTHDEFVPIEKARNIFAHANEPKQFALIEADGHRFGGQLPAFWQALDRAFAWFESVDPKSQR